MATTFEHVHSFEDESLCFIKAVLWVHVAYEPRHQRVKQHVVNQMHVLGIQSDFVCGWDRHCQALFVFPALSSHVSVNKGATPDPASPDPAGGWSREQGMELGAGAGRARSPGTTGPFGTRTPLAWAKDAAGGARPHVQVPAHAGKVISWQKRPRPWARPVSASTAKFIFSPLCLVSHKFISGADGTISTVKSKQWMSLHYTLLLLKALSGN